MKAKIKTNLIYLKIWIVIIFTLVSCTSRITQSSTSKVNISKPIYRPNILWIVTEDISPSLSFYGDSTAKTLNLDALADESMIYDNAFAPVGVCAPSRSSIITGMYPTTLGTMHMRTGKDVFSWGKRKYKDSTEINNKDLNDKNIREYSAVIPDYVKCFSEYIRAAGYYCINNQKTDYQFAAPLTAWDENNGKAHWRNRPKDKPFFAVFNIGTTHESRLWKNKELPLTINPNDVNVPPYLPDNEATRKTIARNYNNIELMDAEVGVFINQLKEDGLYDNTIIFFYSDHGGPLPRQKREIYDSGLKVPLMIKDINSKAKRRSDRLISFVDLAPTILSLIGMPIPKYMQGKAFLGLQNTKPREYVFGSSDRFDEYSDRIRSVRSKRYLYLKNYFPKLPKYKDIGYRKKVPMMPIFLDLKEKGELNDFQKIWFDTKKSEELYDCIKDPHNIHNLVDDSDYISVLKEMRIALSNHLQSAPDLGQIPETQLIKRMWPNFEQPKTVSPIITIKGNIMIVSSLTKGASIAYLISDKKITKLNRNAKWQLYTHPIRIEKNKYYNFVSERIGFQTSEIVSKWINENID